MIRTYSSSNSGFSFFQHSNSAVVAIGYYGEVGYSNTPVFQNSSLSLQARPFSSDLALRTRFSKLE
jgi:hypothetical protein